MPTPERARLDLCDVPQVYRVNHGVVKVSVYLGSTGTAVSPPSRGVVVVVLLLVVIVAIVVVIVLSWDSWVLAVPLAIALQVPRLVSVVLPGPRVPAMAELVLAQQLGD